MALVLVLAAGLWGLGALTKTPQNARWLMIGLLYVAVLFINIALPDGHILREQTGRLGPGNGWFWAVWPRWSGAIAGVWAR